MGVQFLQVFGSVLSQRQGAGALPQQLREAWAFAAAVSVARAACTLHSLRRADPGRGIARRARWGRPARLLDRAPVPTAAGNAACPQLAPA